MAQQHPGFARLYETMMTSLLGRRFMAKLRYKVMSYAYGNVLEVGSGNGMNFGLYDPAHVQSVDAVEPDGTMLSFARPRAAAARVPIMLSQQSAESLAFPDQSFDCVVVTLVMCSVDDPDTAAKEMYRVLKPGGSLLLFEHVASTSRPIRWIQDSLVPVTTRLTGNCHWNRETANTIRDAGFAIREFKNYAGGVHPIIFIRAERTT